MRGGDVGKIFILVILLGLAACSGQTKDELVQEGDRLLADGNARGAVVLYKNALEKDTNFLLARSGLAEAYLTSGNLERAENEFKKVLLQNPSKTDNYLKLASIYLQQNSFDDAFTAVETFHSKSNETVDSLVLSGRIFEATGDFPSAENLFNKALSLDAKSIAPRMGLARVYLNRDNPERAAAYLQQILADDSGCVDAYYQLADIAMRQGDYRTALQIYSDLLAVDGEQPQAIYMSSVIMLETGDLDSVAQSIDRLELLYPDSADVLRLKGMLFYRQGDFDEARTQLKRSISGSPHLLSYLFLGLSYYGLEQYELALNQFQKALDINSDLECARTLVAVTLLKQQRVDDAIIGIRKVVRNNPSNAYAYNILGSALLANGEFDEGMTALDRATELDPELADAHMKKGLFQLSQGELGAGEIALVKAVKAAPEVLNSRLMLVTHYLRQEDYSSAIQTLNEGMSGGKDEALFYNYLAIAYFAQKKNDQAISALQSAKNANPAYLTPYFQLASFYTSQSRYDAAIAEYRDVLKQDQGNLQSLLALAALYNVKGESLLVAEIFQQIEKTGSEQAIVAAVQYKLRNNQLEEALKSIDAGLEKNKSSAQLLEVKGLVSIQQKQYADAESALTQLALVSPERGNSFLVRLYLSQGRVAKAEQLIADLLVVQGDEDYPYLLSSSLLLTQDKEAEAQSVLERGIARSKNANRLKLQLGRLYELQTQQPKAQQVYLDLIEEQPEFAPVYTVLGALKEKANCKGEALELYRKAVSLDDENVSALNNLAYLLIDNFGERESALTYAMSAYRLKPSDPRIMDTLGFVLLGNGRYQEAVKLLEEAYEQLPEVPAVALHLAQAKMESGLKDEALSLLEDVRNNGQDAEIKQAEQLLKQL
jgi:putative PEP-CTERM system TPR-repeat lipoprotein